MNFIQDLDNLNTTEVPSQKNFGTKLNDLNLGIKIGDQHVCIFLYADKILII